MGRVTRSAKPEVQPPSPVATPGAAASSPGPILVVEDDGDIRETLTVVLKAEGYPVVAVANGREALGQLRSGARPRLILLDLLMPIMDGFEFLAKATDPVLASIPVVALTADQQANQRVASMGVVACVRKPLLLDELLQLIDRYAR